MLAWVIVWVHDSAGKNMEIPALKLSHGVVSVECRKMLLGDGFPGGIERRGD